MSLRRIQVVLLLDLSIATAREPTNLRGSNDTTNVTNSTDDLGRIASTFGITEANTSNMSIEASGVPRCCRFCPGYKFCSPFTNVCYNRRWLPYYKGCSVPSPAPSPWVPVAPPPQPVPAVPLPHPTPSPAPQPTLPSHGSSCLCIFDLDRTLTGVQGELATCPDNKIISGQWDDAYDGGILTLSHLGQRVQTTFCAGCHLAVITAHATPRVYLEALVSGRVVRGCDKGCKAREAAAIAHQLGIQTSEVFMFDDKKDNVWPFHGTGMNARQVSCDSRSGSKGKCGATSWEVQRQYGVRACQ